MLGKLGGIEPPRESIENLREIEGWGKSERILYFTLARCFAGCPKQNIHECEREDYISIAPYHRDLLKFKYSSSPAPPHQIPIFTPGMDYNLNYLDRPKSHRQVHNLSINFTTRPHPHTEWTRDMTGHSSCAGIQLNNILP